MLTAQCRSVHTCLRTAQHTPRPRTGVSLHASLSSLPQPVPEPHNTSQTFYVKRLTSSEHRSKVATVHCFPGKANVGAGVGLVEGKWREYRLTPSLCSVSLFHHQPYTWRVSAAHCAAQKCIRIYPLDADVQKLQNCADFDLYICLKYVGGDFFFLFFFTAVMAIKQAAISAITEVMLS